MSQQKKADLMLVCATALWGFSYYSTDLCLTELEPMTLNAFRFMAAFIVLGFIFRKNLVNANRKTLLYSLLIGICLTGTYIFYNYGITRTSLTNAGFICALAVLFIPVYNCLFRKQLPEGKLAISLLFTVIGLACMTLGNSLRPALGDIICMGVPLCYTADLLITEKAVSDSDVDPIAVGVFQLGVVSLITLVLSFAFEQPHLPQSAGIWAHVLFLGIFCSGVTFVIQSTQQKYTSTVHIGLIFSLEPVFAALCAYLLAGEVLTSRGYLGMALMIAGLLLMELELPLKNKKDVAL